MSARARFALVAAFASASAVAMTSPAWAQQQQRAPSCFIQLNPTLSPSDAVAAGNHVCREIERLQIPGEHYVDVGRVPEGIVVTVVAKPGERSVREPVARLEDVPAAAPSVAQAMAREQGFVPALPPPPLSPAPPEPPPGAPPTPPASSPPPPETAPRANGTRFIMSVGGAHHRFYGIPVWLLGLGLAIGAERPTFGGYLSGHYWGGATEAGRAVHQLQIGGTAVAVVSRVRIGGGAAFAYLNVQRADPRRRDFSLGLGIHGVLQVDLVQFDEHALFAGLRIDGAWFGSDPQLWGGTLALGLRL